MIFGFLILGFIFLLWMIVILRRQSKFQNKIQQKNTGRIQNQLDRKKERENGRAQRTTVQEWEKEFEVLDASQYFNPRRGDRLFNLNFEKHDYQAAIEEFPSETGSKVRRLVVNDSQGRLIKVNILTDNIEARAYKDCVITDSIGRIIGGWQLAHEDIPYEFTAASINSGYIYSDALDLPTTVPLGYNPNPSPGGFMISVRYSFLIEGREKEIHEEYLENHYAEYFPKGPPGGAVVFKKIAGIIHVSPALNNYDQEPKEPSPAECKKALELIKKLQERRGNQERQPQTKNIGTEDLVNESQKANPSVTNAKNLTPVSSQAFASMLLRQKELQAAAKGGEILSKEEEKELVMLAFLLGSPGEEAIIKKHELSLEDAKDIHAIGGFSFGDIKSLLTGQGLSRGEVMSFLGDVQSGKLTLTDAIQFLEDCKEWNEIKSHTDLSKKEYFARKLAADRKFPKINPSNN